MQIWVAIVGLAVTPGCQGLGVGVGVGVGVGRREASQESWLCIAFGLSLYFTRICSKEENPALQEDVLLAVPCSVHVPLFSLCPVVFTEKKKKKGEAIL